MYIYGMKEYKVAKERFVFNRSIIISSRFVEFKNGSREVVRKRTRRESNCKYWREYRDIIHDNCLLKCEIEKNITYRLRQETK